MPKVPRIIHRMNRAVAYWLKYESASGRAKMFSEKTLAIPIANCLSTEFGRNFHVEYNYAFGKKVTPNGRPTQLDYAVTKRTRGKETRLIFAVETKFITAKTNISSVSLLKDIVRLESIPPFKDRRRFFLVCGKAGKIQKHLALLGENFIPENIGEKTTIRLSNLPKNKIRQIQAAAKLSNISSSDLPAAFKISRVSEIPWRKKGIAQNNGSYVSVVFEVQRSQNRMTFKFQKET
jgi:hypothetical protein